MGCEVASTTVATRAISAAAACSFFAALPTLAAAGSVSAHRHAPSPLLTGPNA